MLTFTYDSGNGSLSVGYEQASYNSRLITNGGSVTINGTLYLSQVSGDFNNTISINGTGSVLNTGTLVVSSEGGGTGTIGSGGSLIVSNITIAQSSGSAGTLNVGTLAGSDTNISLSAQSITFAGGAGTLNFNQSDDTTIFSPISGIGSVNQLGSGTTILAATNSYSSLTYVKGGQLTVATNGALAAAGVIVAAGGTLENKGVICATTMVNGTLAGNRGSLASLTLNAGSFLNWSIDNFTGTVGTNWDELTAQSLDLSSLTSSNPLTINILGTSGPGNGSSIYTFNYLSITGTLTGFDPNHIALNSANFTVDPGLSGGTWSIQTNNFGNLTQIDLIYAVPEPSTDALLGLGAMALAIVFRRRQCKSYSNSRSRCS